MTGRSRTLLGGFILALVVPSVAKCADAAKPAPARTLVDLHADFLRLIQGDPAVVAATPALCSEAGLKSLVGESTKADLNRWYFGPGACVQRYPTDLEATITRGTKGFSNDLLRSRQTVSRLRELLTEILAQVAAETVSPQQRLMLHSTSWEIGHAIDAARALGDTPGLRAASCDNFRLLSATSHSAQQAAALPSTLAALPRLAAAPEIAGLVEKIVSRDPSVVELLSPSEAHANVLLGRFTPRLFLSAETQSEQRRLRSYLLGDGAQYGTMGRLPLHVGGVTAILVLYFNVVTLDLRILPTDQVAFWQQYSFSRKLDLAAEELSQAEDTLHFRSIRYRRDPTGDAVRYRQVPENAMARLGFVDAMPPGPGASVTTLRGSCMKCHRRVISSFHPEEERQVRFTAPLRHSGRELLTPIFERRTESRFRRWAAFCAAE